MIFFPKEDLSIFSVRLMVYLTRLAGFLEATHSRNYMFGEWKASVRTSMQHLSVPLKPVWMWKWNQEISKEMGSPRSMTVKGMGLHAFPWVQDSFLSMPVPNLEALDFTLLRKMPISLGTSNRSLKLHLRISVLNFRFCMLYTNTEYDLSSKDSKWKWISFQKLVANSHEITQANCQILETKLKLCSRQ